MELFVALEKRGGTALVFSDDERIVERAKSLKHISYGTNENAEVKGKLIASDPFVRFAWQTKEISNHEVQTQMVGNYNLSNLIAACATGYYFKIDVEEIDDAIASYSPDNNRSQVVKCGTNTLLLDAYNANPSSMRAAIENISKMKGAKKMLVLGDMFELGETSQKEHQYIVNLIGELIPDSTVVLVGELFSKTKYRFNSIKFSDSKSAAEWMKNNLPENSLILIKGSRGMKMEQCANVLMC